MQKEYINLDLGDKAMNGNYMLAVFHLVAAEGMDLLDAASEVAAESSTGSNLRVGTATPFADSLDALVYKVDKEKSLVWIAYPWRIFDRGGNVQNILTYIAGNVFGMAEIKACKLLDVWFPREMLDQYDGPSYTIDDMRKYLNVYERPILGTIIKPKIGLTNSEYAEVCYNFWSGGGDFVKNDEPQADQDFCPYFKMVDDIREAMDRAEAETGHTKVHSFNISSPDFDTMKKRADYVIQKMKPGSYAFLVDGITAGWMAVQTARRLYPNVYLHFHRAGHGAMTRDENPIGYTVLVLSKFARLVGASGVHTGTAGIGKMA
nr:ribulose 1,5-bisphosphate carboxylase [Candidatus Gracilibacteria bacterium]